MLRKLIYTLFILSLLLGTSIVSIGQDSAMVEFEITQEMVDASPYLQSVIPRLDQEYDTSEFAKDPPYRIALAAQGTSNAWSALFDAHAYWYVDELGEDVSLGILVRRCAGQRRYSGAAGRRSVGAGTGRADSGADGRGRFVSAR